MDDSLELSIDTILGTKILSIIGTTMNIPIQFEKGIS